MTIRNSTLVKAAVLLAAISGSVTGLRATAANPTWPNQCWNNDGGPTCPICGGTCLGGQYLCCNNGANRAAPQDVVAN